MFWQLYVNDELCLALNQNLITIQLLLIRAQVILHAIIDYSTEWASIIYRTYVVYELNTNKNKNCECKRNERRKTTEFIPVELYIQKIYIEGRKRIDCMSVTYGIV